MRLVFLVIGLAAFTLQAAPTLKAAVTVPPYLHLLQALGGERVDAVGLVPAGANPHTWEPTPATLKAFSGTHIYFTDSSGMDLPWLPRFRAANSRTQIVNFAHGLQWLAGHKHHDEGEGETHGSHEEHGDEHHDSHEKEHPGNHEMEQEAGLDPHIWSSPKQVIALAVQMSASLMAFDTAGIPYYKQRLAEFLTRVHRLDAALKNVVKSLPVEKRQFIVFHPSYGYLARDYGLTQLSVEIEGKEPKPADLAQLVKTAQAQGIHTIFVQPQFNQRSAETLAREIHGTVRTTDPLSQDWEKNLWSFVEAMKLRIEN